MPQRGSSIELTRTLRRVKVPSFVAASDGTVTWGNEAAEKMFGDLRRRPFATVVAPEDVPLVQRQLERKLRGVPLTDYEVDVFTADGRRRRAEISSVPIENGDDSPKCCSITREVFQQAGAYGGTGSFPRGPLVGRAYLRGGEIADRA